MQLDSNMYTLLVYIDINRGVLNYLSNYGCIYITKPQLSSLGKFVF
jgi:hypothetical protein